MTSHVFCGWSFLRLLFEGSRADRLERGTRFHGKHHASFRLRDHLRSGLQSPCHPCLRGRRHRASKRWERDHDLVLVCHLTSGPWVLLGSSRWVRLSCIVKRLSYGRLCSADPRTQTRRHASSSPSLLASAGAVRQLADAVVHVVQRLAEESPVSASLSSLTACRASSRSSACGACWGAALT